MTKPDHSRKNQDAPGGVITAYAFKYSGSFYDFAEEKFPELKRYPPNGGRVALLEAAIIVSTLIMMERRSGGAGWKELHDGVSRAFAPSVQHRQLAAIQDLACALLPLNRGGLKAAEIPPFAGLAGAPDEKLSSSIGLWLIRTLARKQQLEPADLPIAAAIGRSAWTSAAMIVRMLGAKTEPPK